MSSTPKTVSVVVCTRNRPAELDRCLASLGKLVPPANEIVVVNSAGEESAREIAAAHGAKYIATQTPGLSYARNLGAASARSELIGFVDDDGTANPDWLGMLSVPFDDPKVMVTTGSIETGSVCPSPYVIPLSESRQRVVDRETPGWFWLAASGHLGLGGNMMFRHEAFERWPGFDTRLGRGARIPGAEEHFALFQLVEMGFRVVHVPGAIVQHPPVESGSRYQLQMLEIAAAYMTLLFIEHPRHRMELLRALVSRVARGKSTRTAAAGMTSTVSMLQKIRAGVRGIGLYLRWR